MKENNNEILCPSCGLEVFPESINHQKETKENPNDPNKIFFMCGSHGYPNGNGEGIKLSYRSEQCCLRKEKNKVLTQKNEWEEEANSLYNKIVEIGSPGFKDEILKFKTLQQKYGLT
jgi:hypothetical protein